LWGPSGFIDRRRDRQNEKLSWFSRNIQQGLKTGDEMDLS
jgi:hypothetical protein